MTFFDLRTDNHLDEALIRRGGGAFTEDKSLGQFLKFTGSRIFYHVIPEEYLSIHCDINSGLKCLNGGKRTPQVEQRIGGAKGIGNHRAYQDNRFPFYAVAKKSSRFDHGVRSVCHDNLILRAAGALVQDLLSVLTSHLKTVFEHYFFQDKFCFTPDLI